jgi:hypothetical protein
MFLRCKSSETNSAQPYHTYGIFAETLLTQLFRLQKYINS